MLRITGVELELLTDVDQILFVEGSIRGGLAYISKRFEKAGAKQAKIGDDVIRFFTEILFIDAINLYGKAQTGYLPVNNFRFMKKSEYSLLKFQEMTEDQEYGYIIECDLSYPEELHHLHASFPLAPESMEITSEMLSPYAAGKLH